MSDYTPTTEDIKYAYAHWKGQEPEFDRWLANHEVETIRKAIAYLKTTPAVTLSGQGGAYELLEAYAHKLEDNE